MSNHSKAHRLISFANPRNPHGLRFFEGEDGSAPKPAPPATPAQAPADEAAAAKAEADKGRAEGDDLATWKAEARKWEAQAKANSEAARRLAEIEEASKTEAQKQAEALAEARARLAEYEQRDQIAAWAGEITKDSHVPASALRGTTREELEAHHEALSGLIPKPSNEPTTQQQSGVTTTGQVPQRTGNVPISEQIAAAEQSGNKALVAALKAMQLGAVSA